MTVNLLQTAYEKRFPPEYLFLSLLIMFSSNKSETFRNGKGRKIEDKNVFQGRKCFRHFKKQPFESNNASPAQCLLPLSLLFEVKWSNRSVRFSCVCHFCLRFPDIRSRLQKNSKPKNFICIVRIQFFTFLTKMSRRKPINFRSKSRNKNETDYSSKAKHFSPQCSSRDVEYCYDKTAEMVSTISKNIPTGAQKISFYIFSNKKTALFLKLLFRTRIFDSPDHIFFPKSKYFLPDFQTELKHSMFHFKKFPKWSSGQVNCIFVNLAGKFPFK